MSTRDASAFLHDVLMAIAKLDKVDSALAARLLDSPQISAFRNRLIHNFGQVDHVIVWGVVSAKIPLLHQRVRKTLEVSRLHAKR